MNIKFEIDKLLEGSDNLDRLENNRVTTNPNYNKLSDEQKEKVLSNKEANKHISKMTKSPQYTVLGGLGGVVAGGSLYNLSKSGGLGGHIGDAISNMGPNVATFGSGLLGMGAGMAKGYYHYKKAKNIQNKLIDNNK